MLRSLPLALLLILATAASASAVSFFCGDYGYRCYRPYTAPYEPTSFLDDLWAEKSQYVGSMRLNKGLCRSGFTCVPCEDADRQEDPDAACNARFPECDGDCYAK